MWDVVERERPGDCRGVRNTVAERWLHRSLVGRAYLSKLVLQLARLQLARLQLARVGSI
jgi:hypothetical protein